MGNRGGNREFLFAGDAFLTRAEHRFPYKKDTRLSQEEKLLQTDEIQANYCTYEGDERYQIRNTCIQYVFKRHRPTHIHVLLSKMISSGELSNSVIAVGQEFVKLLNHVSVDLRARINPSDVAAQREVNVKNVDADWGGRFLRCIYI